MVLARTQLDVRLRETYLGPQIYRVPDLYWAYQFLRILNFTIRLFLLHPLAFRLRCCDYHANLI